MIQDDRRLIQRNVVKIGEEKSTYFKKTLLFKKITTSLKSTNFKPIGI